MKKDEGEREEVALRYTLSSSSAANLTSPRGVVNEKANVLFLSPETLAP